MSVQTIVKELRDAGMSDADIADRIGCAVSTVSMWANGERAKRTGDYMLKLFKLHLERFPPRSKANKQRAA